MADNTSEEALLTGNLERMTPDKAVKAVRELCKQLGGDADSFHGNIWPGNIRFDWDGRAILGDPSGEPATKRLPEQAEYVAPEFFWDGSGSAASDVYSLALLLYCAQTKGRLPFQEGASEQDRAEALRQRMKGEHILPPADMSPLLASIVDKALSFNPEERYISPAEFLAALNETDEALPAPVPEESAVYAAIALDTEPEAPEEEAAPDTQTEAAPPEEEAEPVSPVEESLPEPVVAVPDVPAEPEPVPEPEAAPEPPREEPPIPQYTVEKDFEKHRRRKPNRLPAAVKKKSDKKSPLLPLLCLLAVLVIAAVIYVCFFSDYTAPADDVERTTLSEPYVIELTPNPTAVSTPVPAAEETPAPTVEPEATEEISAATEEPETEANAPAEDTLTVTAEANVRSGPGTGYEVLEIAPVGKTYPLLGTVDTWYQVDIDGTTGYVNRNLVTVTEAAEAEAETITLTVVSDVNIRSGAGTGYDILGVAEVGTELTALGPAEDGWYPITYGESGLYAYVAATLVTEK